MSRWNQQFDSHSFQTNWSELCAELKGLKSEDGNLELSYEIARIRKVASYIDSVLKKIDPELISFAQLDIANQNLVSAKDQVKAYVANKNIAHLVEANKALDNVLLFVNQTPFALSAQEEGALKSAADQYSLVLDEYLLGYKNSVDLALQNLKKQIDPLQVELQTSEKLLDTLKSQLVNVGQTIQLQTSEFNKQYSAGEIDRSAKFDLLIEKLNQKADEEFKNLTVKAGSSLKVLSKYLDDAAKVFGVVVNTLQAGAYSSYANTEKRTANWLLSLIHI